MSKFSTTPSALHYAYLKNVACYLRGTKHWGIRYKRSKLREDLPNSEFDSIVPVDNDLPEFSVSCEDCLLFRSMLNDLGFPQLKSLIGSLKIMPLQSRLSMLEFLLKALGTLTSPIICDPNGYPSDDLTTLFGWVIHSRHAAPSNHGPLYDA